MRAVAVVLVGVVLSGCAWLLEPRPERRASAPAVDGADPRRDWMAQQLAAVAGRAEAALGRLSRIEAGRDPIAWREEPRVIPDELLHEVSVDWTGPLPGLTERLAELAGFRYQEVGARPVQPVIVDVHAVEKTVISVLREAGYQAGTRAKVVVDARHSVVELVNRTEVGR